jgi:hypothetical protein
LNGIESSMVRDLDLQARVGGGVVDLHGPQVRAESAHRTGVQLEAFPARAAEPG